MSEINRWKTNKRVDNFRQIPGVFCKLANQVWSTILEKFAANKKNIIIPRDYNFRSKIFNLGMAIASTYGNMKLKSYIEYPFNLESKKGVATEQVRRRRKALLKQF